MMSLDMAHTYEKDHLNNSWTILILITGRRHRRRRRLRSRAFRKPHLRKSVRRPLQDRFHRRYNPRSVPTPSPSTTSLTHQALNDVISAHKKKLQSFNPNDPDGWRGSVINMSFDYPNDEDSPALEDALWAAYDAGIPMAAAAGNYGVCARRLPCTYVPLFTLIQYHF